MIPEYEHYSWKCMATVTANSATMCLTYCQECTGIYRNPLYPQGCPEPPALTWDASFFNRRDVFRYPYYCGCGGYTWKRRWRVIFLYVLHWAMFSVAPLSRSIYWHLKEQNMILYPFVYRNSRNIVVLRHRDTLSLFLCFQKERNE